MDEKVLIPFRSDITAADMASCVGPAALQISLDYQAGDATLLADNRFSVGVTTGSVGVTTGSVGVTTGSCVLISVFGPSFERQR